MALRLSFFDYLFLYPKTREASFSATHYLDSLVNLVGARTACLLFIWVSFPYFVLNHPSFQTDVAVAYP